MPALEDRLRSSLDSRRRRSMLRSLDRLRSSDDLADFSSNDYLSLSTSPTLHARLVSDLASAPTSSTVSSSSSAFGPSSSRLLDGNTSLHRSLELRLVAFFRGPGEGLLFNSGFDANVGIWSTLPTTGDWIVYDEFIHASTHDGMRGSRTEERQRLGFRHNDVGELRRTLEGIVGSDTRVREGKASVFVAVETLYSMDGDLCPLPEMLATVEQALPSANGHLILDEAHSTGLYGPAGRGLAAHYDVTSHPRLLVRLHTFGKAAACSGAVIICSPLIRDYVVNYARPLIYSTVMMRVNVRAIWAAVDEFESPRREEAARRLDMLWRHSISLLRAILPSSSHLLRFPSHLASPTASAPDSLPSPILPLLTSQPRSLSARLVGKGYLVRPIVYPTVPQGLERVRVCLHAGNTVAEIEGLIGAVREWVEDRGAVGAGDELVGARL